MSGVENLVTEGYSPDQLGVQLQGSVVPSLKELVPQIFQLLQQQQMPFEQSQLDISKAITPQYNDLAVQELGRVAPQLAAVQSATDAAQAKGDLANLTANGVPLAEQMRAIDSAANPEYAANLATLGSKMTDALGALSPKLSAGSRAEIERGNARSGTAANDAAGTAANAMNFGRAATAQANSFATAISQVAGALPQLRSGINPIGLALGRDSRSSGIVGQASGGVAPSQTTAATLGKLFDSVVGMENNRQNNMARNYKSFGDAAAQDASAIGSIMGGVGSVRGA